MLLPTALVLAAAAPAAGGGGLQDILESPLLFIGVMVVLMYFLLLRPQQQRARQHQQMVGAIKRGDSVVLSSGMIGKVVRVEDAELGVEIAQNVTVKVVKSMVSEVRARGEPAAANDAKKS
jgi:preprotein translocase subunit YajC